MSMEPETTTIWRIMFRDNTDGKRHTKFFETEERYIQWMSLLKDKSYWDVEVLSHGPKQFMEVNPLSPPAESK